MLQEKNCVAIQFDIPGLYCRGWVKRLCHNTKFCIVTVDWACRRACLGAGRAGLAGARGRRTLSRGAAGRAAGKHALQAGGTGARQAGNGRQAHGQARRGRAGARGWSHGARGARPAWAWPGRWMGAQAGPTGPVLVHCAPGLVLARFLDPVRLGIFLSHQKNTVHCKKNFFFQKKKIIFIKFK